MKKISYECAIEKINQILSDKKMHFLGFYDKYHNKTEWFGASTYLKLKCEVCSYIFYIRYNHLVYDFQKCPKCTHHVKLNTTEVKDKINSICSNNNLTFNGFVDKNNKYVEWYGNKTLISLHCNICGNDFIRTYSHLMDKGYCSVCFKTKKKSCKNITTELNAIINTCLNKNYEFLGFYDKEHKPTVWKTVDDTYLGLHCNKCNIDWYTTTYYNFIKNGYGCPQCAKELRRKKKLKSQDEALEKIQKFCLQKKYSFLGYCDNEGKQCEWFGVSTYLKLKCNICGYEWTTCTYDNFTRGKGCPKCKKSHLEEDVIKILEKHQINDYHYNKHYKWLDNLQLDFYLPQYNIAIECQGIQHFKPIDFAGKGDEWANEIFKEIIERDERKRRLCEENGVKLLYYSNLGIKYPYKVFEDKDELLKEFF